jgi:hypothetical protein
MAATLWCEALKDIGGGAQQSCMFARLLMQHGWCGIVSFHPATLAATSHHVSCCITICEGAKLGKPGAAMHVE